MMNTLYVWVVWLLLLIFFAFYIWKRHRYLKGYDPQMTEYEPPEKINPMMCGFLVDRTLHIRDILAGILFLHQKGVIDFEKADPGIGFMSSSTMKLAQEKIEYIACQKGYLFYPIKSHKILGYVVSLLLFAGVGLYVYIYQIQQGGHTLFAFRALSVFSEFTFYGLGKCIGLSAISSAIYRTWIYYA